MRAPRISRNFADDLERQLIDIGVRRANLLVRLRRAEESRQKALEVLPGLASRAILSDIAATLNEGLEMSTELTRLETRADGIRTRLADVTTEQRLLRTVSRQLTQVPGESVADPHQRASRYSQAARQIYEIADVEHAETARIILEGPMQRLADAALEAELIGRSLAREPETAAGASTRCRTAAVEASDQLGDVIAGLLPLSEGRGLVGAIRELLAAWSDRGSVLLHILGSERRMGSLAEITMYRILEQGIDNALAHGHPAARRRDHLVPAAARRRGGQGRRRRVRRQRHRRAPGADRRSRADPDARTGGAGRGPRPGAQRARARDRGPRHRP